MGVFKHALASLRTDRTIRGLPEEQKQTIVDYVREYGATIPPLNEPLTFVRIPDSSPEEEIRFMVALVATAGGDKLADAFLRTLISRAS